MNLVSPFRRGGAVACIVAAAALLSSVQVRAAESLVATADRHYAQQSYGKLINLMLAVEGSAEAVVGKLRQPGTPKRIDYPAPPGQGKVLPSG